MSSDSPKDPSAKIVRRMSLIVSSRSSTALLSRALTSGSATRRPGALQAEPDGEEALDDQIVQVASDPITILEHCQPLLVAACPCQLDRERCLLGEAGRHRPASTASNSQAFSGYQASTSAPATTSEPSGTAMAGPRVGNPSAGLGPRPRGSSREVAHRQGLAGADDGASEWPVA